MKQRTKNALREMAKHLRLKVSFVSYFGDETHGKLIPREGRILINANKPREEHVFTLLHEIGHFLLHFKSPPRKYHPRLFDINWQLEWLMDFCSTVRRALRFHFNKESGKEWQADLWAMCAFIYLAKHIGCRDELKLFLDRHPDKLGVFLLASYASAYCGMKTRIRNATRLLNPFNAL